MEKSQGSCQVGKVKQWWRCLKVGVWLSVEDDTVRQSDLPTRQQRSLQLLSHKLF